jgi:hypothetical protein
VFMAVASNVFVLSCFRAPMRMIHRQSHSPPLPITFAVPTAAPWHSEASTTFHLGDITQGNRGLEEDRRMAMEASTKCLAEVVGESGGAGLCAVVAGKSARAHPLGPAFNSAIFSRILFAGVRHRNAAVSTSTLPTERLMVPGERGPVILTLLQMAPDLGLWSACSPIL